MTTDTEPQGSPSVRQQKELLRGRTFPLLGLFPTEQGGVFGMAQTELGMIYFKPVEKQLPFFDALKQFPEVRKIAHTQYKLEDLQWPSGLGYIGAEEVTFEKFKEGSWQGRVAVQLDTAAYNECSFRIPLVAFDLCKLVRAYEVAAHLTTEGVHLDECTKNASKILTEVEKVYSCRAPVVGKGELETRCSQGMKLFGKVFDIQQWTTPQDLAKVCEVGNTKAQLYFDKQGELVAGTMLHQRELARIGGLRRPNRYLIDIWVNPEKVNPLIGVRSMFNIAYWGLTAQGKSPKGILTHGLSEEHANWLEKEVGFTQRLAYASSRYILLEHKF